MGEEFGRSSTGHLWLRISYEVTVKVLAKAEVTGRLARGGRPCFPGGSLTGWLWVGGLDPSPHSRFCVLATIQTPLEGGGSPSFWREGCQRIADS